MLRSEDSARLQDEVEEPEPHRIWGARSPLNEASAKTMEAAGMVEEGTIRGHILKAGRWRDSAVHAMLADEGAAVSQTAWAPLSDA